MCFSEKGKGSGEGAVLVRSASAGATASHRRCNLEEANKEKMSEGFRAARERMRKRNPIVIVTRHVKQLHNQAHPCLHKYGLGNSDAFACGCHGNPQHELYRGVDSPSPARTNC